MRRILCLAAVVCLSPSVKAQTFPADTIPASKKDSALLEEAKENLLDNIPTISLGDGDMSDGAAQNVSSVLTAGRDPFFSAAAFSFSPLRFRIRGYDNDLNTLYMNGIPMDNLDNGFTPFGLWGGLNDVMRNRDIVIGLRPNTFSFGELGSSTNIDARASRQRAQTNIGYAISNRNYRHRVNITHSSGLNKQGWAYSISASFRGADEGFVPGTFYNGYSYFLSVDKKLGNRHLLSFTTFGAPTQSGRQTAAVQEAMILTGGNYYNPGWGYQNGEKRNANQAHTFQPFFILTHDYRINNKTNLITAAGYSTGDRFTTAIDWYNAPDPRPDYYRNLPSFQTSESQKALVAEAWRNDPSVSQIDWKRLYDVNRSSFQTIQNVNGVAGNTLSGKRSRYILEERVNNSNRFQLNSVLNTQAGRHMEFTSGLTVQYQQNHYFKRVNDLLGGEFYVNLNQFAERNYPNNNIANQFDADVPNRILTTGSRFGQDYNISILRGAAYGQVVAKYDHWDFFGTAELSQTTFHRTGNVRNGLFPDNSLGKGQVFDFTNYSLKGGVTYKIDGRHYLYVNGALMIRAPFFENVYVSARTRDLAQENVTNEKISSIEGGYTLNAPKLKFRLTGYYTEFRDAMNVLSFYHDDFRNLVNYAISGIGRQHFGGEMGFEWKAVPNVSISGAVALGRYYYKGRQRATVTLDNDASILQKTTVYADGFRVGSTPQEAYNLGITYRSPKFWFVSLSANYFDQMWLDFNPIRRTSSAVDGLDVSIKADRDKYYEILQQTRWKPQYTIDAFFGYSYKVPRKWGLKKSTFIIFNLGVNNITNNQNMVTGGFEQLRFDFADLNVNKFPPKLYYAYGLNYFGSLSFRF